jgi:hypothetical protein
VPPGAEANSANGRRARDGETQFAGGIVRFGLSSSKDADSDVAGGIVRFSLGSGQH